MRVPRPPAPSGRTLSASSLGVAVLIAATGAVGLVSAPAASAAGRVVLDPSDAVVDVAAQGRTVAWLSGAASADGGTVRPRYLSVRDAGATTARRLALRLPAGTDGIDVGTDASGRPIALLGTRTHTWTVPLAPGTDPVARRIPGSARWGAVALFRGRVAYTRISGGRAKVLVARRQGAAGRTAFRFPRGFEPVDLGLGRDDVVFAHGYRAVDVGVADAVWRARGGEDRQVLRQSTGGASENGMGPVTVSADGAKANVSRWNVGGGHPNDLTTFSVRTGRVLSTVRAATDPGAEAVFQLGLDARESVLSAASFSGCSGPSAPDPSAPPCLGVTLLTR